MKYWVAKDHLPGSEPDISIAEIKCHYYMGTKTAWLILLGLTGRNFGISVDRHLKDAFRSMGWVLESCSDEEQISLMIEAWLDRALWGECNNVVDGWAEAAMESALGQNAAVSCLQVSAAC